MLRYLMRVIKRAPTSGSQSSPGLAAFIQDKQEVFSLLSGSILIDYPPCFSALFTPAAETRFRFTQSCKSELRVG